MPDRTIALTDAEATLAAQGKLGALLRVAPDVVSWGSEPKYIATSNMPVGWYSMIYSTDCGLQPHGKPLRCPFPAPGQRLGLKESWADLRGTGFPAACAYKANEMKDFGDGLGLRESRDVLQIRFEHGIVWRSPVTMPAWAIRRWPTVQEVRAVQMGKLYADRSFDFAYAEHMMERKVGGETWVWFARLEWEAVNA